MIVFVGSNPLEKLQGSSHFIFRLKTFLALTNILPDKLFCHPPPHLKKNQVLVFLLRVFEGPKLARIDGPYA